MKSSPFELLPPAQSVIYAGNDDVARTESEPAPARWVSSEDPTSEQFMRIMEVSGALEFWDRPEEDVYSEDDGEPVQ